MWRCCLRCAGAVLHPALLAKGGPGKAGPTGAAHTPHAVALMRARLALQSSVQVGVPEAWAPPLYCPGTPLMICNGFECWTPSCGGPPLCALQPTQSRRLSEPARLPAAHAACAALPQPAAGTAGGAVPEQELPGERADMSIQAERNLPHHEPGPQPGTGPDAHMADAQQELYNKEPGLLSGTVPDVAMVEAERELHTKEPGVQSVAGPDAVMTEVDGEDSASAAAEAAVAAEISSMQVAYNEERPQAAAGVGSGLPPAEAAALAESGSELHVEGLAGATAAGIAAEHLVGPGPADRARQQRHSAAGEARGAAASSSRPGRAAGAAAEAQLPGPRPELKPAQLPPAVPAMAGPTSTPEPGQQMQAAAPQPGSGDGPVQKQAAGCEQPVYSSDQMASCSEAGLEGAAREADAGCGQAAVQEQEVVQGQAPAQKQETGCGQAAAWDKECVSEQAAAQGPEAGCGQAAAREQEAHCAQAPQPADQQLDCSQAEGQSLPGRARRCTRRMTRAAAAAGAAADCNQAIPPGAKQRTLLAAMEAGGTAAAGGWQPQQQTTDEPEGLQAQAAQQQQQQQQANEGTAAAAVQDQVAPAAATRRRSRAAAAGGTAARAAPAGSRQLMPGIAEEPEALEADTMLQCQPASQVCARQT